MGHNLALPNNLNISNDEAGFHERKNMTSQMNFGKNLGK